MSRGRTRRSTGPLLVIAAVTIAIAGFTALPADAHSFTRNDGNDSRGKLDLRSASVGHTKTGVVHTLRTYEPWTAKSLGADSYFIVQIDKNKDRTYERCAFIYFEGRLRGLLSNCRAQFIRFLPVVKLSGTAAKVTIPKTQTGAVYWWAGASWWEGTPCGNGCVDFVPNLFPDILHDMKPPLVTMPTTPLRIWTISDAPTFPFAFSVGDQNVGVKSWKVESRPIGTTAWTTESSGMGGGSKDPEVSTGGPGQFTFRVTATDKQGNKAAKSRQVFVPTDVTDPGGPGTFTGGETIDVVGAYGGSFVALNDATDSYEIEYVHPGGPCRTFELIGPGTGDWGVSASGPAGTTGINAALFDDAQRQILWSEETCADATWTFTLNFGSGFGVDAVLI